MAYTKTPLKGGSNRGWNYTDPAKEGFMESIEGTVVEFSRPQHTNFGTREPEFFPDGNPKLDWQYVIRGRSGRELIWRFYPKGANNPSKAREAVVKALDPNDDKSDVYAEDLLGKFVRISTRSGSYHRDNPRPWEVEILGEGETEYVRYPQDEPVKPQNQYEATQAGAAAALNAINGGPQTDAVYEDDVIPF